MVGAQRISCGARPGRKMCIGDTPTDQISMKNGGVGRVVSNALCGVNRCGTVDHDQ
jgi:hypothetical protein